MKLNSIKKKKKKLCSYYWTISVFKSICLHSSFDEVHEHISYKSTYERDFILKYIAYHNLLLFLNCYAQDR